MSGAAPKKGRSISLLRRLWSKLPGDVFWGEPGAKRGRWARPFWLTAGIIAAAGTGSFIGGITVLSQGLPEVMELEQFRPPASTLILADDATTVIAEFATERRTPVPLERMPKNMINAVVAIEDHRYFDHIGINVGRICKALVKDILAGAAVEGGSTITQQLAKVLFLTPEKTISRKVREAMLAFEIEKLYTKEEILELYLNQIYLGSGAYGVGAAAQVYFGKEIDELTLSECALLAALPKSPRNYNPFRNPARATRRRNTVINRLRILGWITEEEAIAAKADPVPAESPGKQKIIAPYFVEAVRRELVEALDAELVYRGGLRVYTTLDATLHQRAEAALLDGVAKVNTRRPDPKSPAQGALVAIDPHTGEIKAQVGGTDWSKSQFDRTFQSKRQLGSTFKPVIYITALEQGYTQADTLMDAPGDFPGSHPDKPWQPRNYDREFRGQLTLRESLAHSRNLPAIRLLEQVGMERVEATAKRLGLNEAMGQGLATALGVGGATLTDLTAAYAAMPGGGLRPEPHRIRAVFGADGQNLWTAPPAPRRSISPEVAYLAADMLREVVESGTARKARALPFTVAGKTGTTDEQRDASFIGFSSQLALGVWVGRDDNSPLGRGETGGRAALPIWIDIMIAASAKGPPPPLPAPNTVSYVKIDIASGALAGSQCKETGFAAFAAGTAPTEPCARETFTWRHLVGRFGFAAAAGELHPATVGDTP